MLIVVFGHVLLTMGIGGYDSFLSSVLLTFRMPLFFFVSGFFSYRISSWWNRQKVTDVLKRKMQAQVLCTLTFLSVFQYVTIGKVNILHGFDGYWFTIVLFQMYLIYLVLSLVSHKIRFNIVITSLISLSFLGVIVLAFYGRSSWIWNFLCWENLCKYMQFFTLGIICSKYRDHLFKLLDNSMFILIVTLGWIVCMLIWYNNDAQSLFPITYSFIHDILVRYLALMTIVSIFYSSRIVLSDDSKGIGLLRFIGRRTLDIYMIHYFFLPDLNMLSPWLQSNNTIIFQIIIASILTTAIVAMCLLVSAVLRHSKILESWLFGVKRNTAI